MPKFRTHYENLKIARNAPDAVIRAAYKALMQQYHPDKFQGPEQEAHRIAKLIKQSYEILIDPVKRAEHDRWIAVQEEKAKQSDRKVQFGAASEARKRQFYRRENRQEKTKQYQTNEPAHLCADIILDINKSEAISSLLIRALLLALLIFVMMSDFFGNDSKTWVVYGIYIIIPLLVVNIIELLIRLISGSPIVIANEFGLKINKFAGANLDWAEIHEIKFTCHQSTKNSREVFIVEILLNNSDLTLKSQSLWNRFGYVFNSIVLGMPTEIFIQDNLIDTPLVIISDDLNKILSIYKNKPPSSKNPQQSSSAFNKK